MIADHRSNGRAIATGVTLIAALLVGYGVAWLVSQWPSYPDSVPLHPANPAAVPCALEMPSPEPPTAPHLTRVEASSADTLVVVDGTPNGLATLCIATVDDKGEKGRVCQTLAGWLGQ